MKCYQNFSMFDEKHNTPLHTIQNLTDQMKPMVQKTEKKQNFDIILNKYFNDLQLTDIQLQQLSELQKITIDIIKTKNQDKKKRPDEYQKLFYKKAFKYAQITFFKKNKKNKSRRMSQFYHYHFDKVATSYGIPIVNFYHPDKKTKPGLKTGQKSFNLVYIKLILKSKSFQGVCKQFHSTFIRDCISERNKKIKSFISNLTNLIQKNNEDICKTIKFLQSSKCKIPWTNKDINEAWLRASQDLSQESGQKNQYQLIKYQNQQKIQDLMHLQESFEQIDKYEKQIQFLTPNPLVYCEKKEMDNQQRIKHIEKRNIQEKDQNEFQMMSC